MQDRRAAPNLLFVYGTLRAGFDHPMAKLLSHDADFLGPARCQGRLYLVKHYPGLVLSDEPGDVVFGELVRLHTPQASLITFDDYEGCAQASPRRNICGSGSP